MQAISIRQPWAWFILNAGKDCENRDWRGICRYRGNLLIHAAKGMTKREYEEAVTFAREVAHYAGFIPDANRIKRGGIVGMVEMTGHVRSHRSPWFTGPTALLFRRPYPLPFRPYQGQLGLFDVT